MPALAAPAPARIARTRVADRDYGHLPGCSSRLYAKLYGHPGHHDGILARVPDLLAAFEDPPPWWYVRYLDPEPHLRMRLHLPDAGAYGQAAYRGGAWAAGLRDAGLAGRIQFDTYYPETGRYGSGAAMAAAEGGLAPDSAAAIAQAACTTDGSIHPHAVTAASLAHIAAALPGSTAEGMRWLVSHIPKDSGTAPVPRPVHDQAMRLADPRQVWVAQPYQDGALPHEAGQPRRIGREPLVQQLDRDGQPGGPVPAPPDRTHAAGADPVFEHVTTTQRLLSGHGRARYRRWRGDTPGRTETSAVGSICLPPLSSPCGRLLRAGARCLTCVWL